MKRLLLLALTLAPVAAELPPIPTEARQQQSARVVQAETTALKQLRVDSPDDYPKVVYQATAKVTLYLTADNQLLNPNGWDKL